jgi:hypothetical protein
MPPGFLYFSQNPWDLRENGMNPYDSYPKGYIGGNRYNTSMLFKEIKRKRGQLGGFHF